MTPRAVNWSITISMIRIWAWSGCGWRGTPRRPPARRRGPSPHAAPRWRPGPPQTDDRPRPGNWPGAHAPPPAVRRDQLHGAESKRACRWCSRPVAAANRSSAAKGRGQAQREPQRVAVESLNNQPILGQRDRDQRRALSTVWWSTPKCFAIALTRTPRSHIAAARVAIDW